MLFAIGITLVLMATFIPSYVDGKLTKGINEETILTEESRSKNSLPWRTFVDSMDPDAVPVYVKFSVFNVTNAEEFVQGGRPLLDELGPFVYRKVVKRSNIKLERDYQGRRTVSFTTTKYLLFDRSQTPAHLHEDMIIRCIRPSFQLLRHSGASSMGDFAPYPDDVKLFARLSVKDIVFGYFGEKDITGLVPSFMPWPGFGNLTQETDPDVWYTGEDTPADAGQYAMHRGSYVLRSDGADSKLAWDTHDAVRVAGTDGTRFKRGVTCDDGLSALVSEVRRVIPMACRGETTINGIKLLDFAIADIAMRNSTEYPPNAQYDAVGPRGTLNMQRFSLNMSIMYSKPHFLDAPAPQALIDGLRTARALHDTTLGVEPHTGLVMNAHKRLQLNFWTGGPIQGTDWLNKTQDTLFPVFWLDETGTIPAGKAKKFRQTVYMAVDASYYVKWIGSILGSLLLAIALTMGILVQGPAAGTVQGVDASLNYSSMP